MVSLHLGIILAWSSTLLAWPQLRNGSQLLGFDASKLGMKQRDLSARGTSWPTAMGTLPVPRVSKRDAFGNLISDAREKPQKRGPLSLSILHVEQPSGSGLAKRHFESSLVNRSDIAYYVEFYIGDPPQRVMAQLDTGSFELWVNPDCNGLTQLGDKLFCQTVGKYNPSASRLALNTTRGKELKYGIGSANVSYFVDTITLPNSGGELSNAQFGVAKSSKDQFAGILGIGHGYGINTAYNNFIDNLVENKVISTKAYSVGLGSKADVGGVVVFGGVDTSKYSGALAQLPLIKAENSPDKVARFWITMEGMQFTSSSGQTTDLLTSQLPVFLDTGATLSLLPPNLTDSVARAMGSPGNDSNGFYAVDCELAKSPGSVDFKFDGVTIHVPYKEIIRESKTSPPSCYLSIMPSNTFTLLGDSFLRSAYVVFDLSDNKTYMAPYSNCGKNPVNITSSKSISTLMGDCPPQKGEAKAKGNSGSKMVPLASWTFTGVLGIMAFTWATW